MNLDVLTSKIENKTAKLAVIGLGYVGLPLACRLAEVGFDVIGIDKIPQVITNINSGILPIEGNEPGLDDLLKSVTQRNDRSLGSLRGSIGHSGLRDRDLILICVETPVDESHIPQYAALRSALMGIEEVIKPGALVIVESTIAPGTMEKVVRPLLESNGKQLNNDFYLGHCPERVMPGKLLANLTHVSRVVGGMTLETANTMIALYRQIVLADLDPTDCITAELVKTTENTYRDVQIAFANEVALICEAVGGDVWKVRELVNKSPHRNMHLPGAGVGGHCIPKDPWLLAHSVRDQNVPLRLIPVARGINDSMPLHVADLLQRALKSHGKELLGAKILVLGYTYLEDSDDTRNSPSEVLVQRLQELSAGIVIHDPNVVEYQGEILMMAGGCDAAVIMVKHQPYRELDLPQLAKAMKYPIIIDGRAVIDPDLAREAGFYYFGIGQVFQIM